MRLILSVLIACCAAVAYAQDNGGGIGIAAVVDDQVISTADLNERIDLAMGTAGLPPTPETRARIAPQILRQLVDEKLQMEEGTRDGITISDAKLREGIAQIEKQSGKPAGSLEGFVDSQGLSKLSLYAQVRAQMVWSEIVLKKVRPKVRISDNEIARYIQRKEAPEVNTASSNPAGNIKEALISTLRLAVDSPKNESNIRNLADKLASEIRSGASFEAVSSQFSSSTGGTKATGSFWVEVSQLDPAIAQALRKTPKGGITDPVRTPNGYQIVKLVDVRQSPNAPAAPAVEEPRAELAFKQILMTLKPDAKVKEAELLLELAKEVQKSPGKCQEKSMAGAGDLSDMDFRVTLTRALSTDLPEKLRDFLLRLKVGAASDPVVTPQGIRLFMLCERIDLPSGKAAVASNDDIRQSIYKEKLELEAQKYMRDLRRAAFIEIRAH